MNLAYADPPYPGQSDIYAARHDYAGEVDHSALLQQLDPYDGWALSTSARALPTILQLSVELGRPIRVAAWFRGQRNHHSFWPASSWEPVVFAGGRHLTPAATPDSFILRPGHRTTDPDYIIGQKPAAFCYWIFELLGASPNDTLTDIFPGSGIVGRCWQSFQHRQLPPAGEHDMTKSSPRSQRDINATKIPERHLDG